jgi:tRNA1Val (adenine37-N6)-methyltransferase
VPVSIDKLGSLTILQPKLGYRFSIDSVLLAWFASLKKGPVADLGAGCGILCCLLARRGLRAGKEAGPFTAVEIDIAAARCARLNLRDLKAVVLRHDARQPHPLLPRQGFNLVISNPPFGIPGQGKVSPNPRRALARHQRQFTLDDLWRVSYQLLTGRGRLAFCLPPRLLDQALTGLSQHGFAAKRLRLVHGRVSLAAKIALLEAVKDGRPELTVHPPLVVYEQNALSPEVAAIYGQL